MPALPLALGPRSTEIMLLLWSQSTALRGREIEMLLNVPLAYTTVMSLLNSLVRQGLLDRLHDTEQHCYLYQPTCSLEAYVQRTTQQLRTQFGLDANEHAARVT